MTNQEFNEKSTLLNTELKWSKFWGIYSVTLKTNDMQEFISVTDRRIYFNDGTSSELFNSDDEAIIQATKIINNKA